MNKLRTSLKYFRLSLLFALVVFLIILCTMCLVFFGTQVLSYFGFLKRNDFERFPLFIFCLISVIIGTILAVVLGRMPLKPIRELMRATDKIADGDYSVRLSLRGPEEFRQLGEKFNHMAEELGSVEMLRTDFVNNFSHEFKTPIVSIRGFAKALKWEDLSPEERDNYLDIIINESERLSALSTNVLYLSKIEKQTILTKKKYFNLSEQIRIAVVLLDKKIVEKHLNILFDSKEYFVIGNEEMIKQVWINLLDNAIKFSPVKGTIEIRIKQTEENISVKISDQGTGMSPTTKERIFDKFYQGDLSHSANGNGLGLAIVKKIIDLHSGRIVVRSSDKGSIFEIILKNE